MRLLKKPYVPGPWASPTHPARVVAEGAGCFWMSAPMMLGNYRLVGIPKAPNGVEQDWNPAWGWCFRGELALMAAVNVWQPEVEDEPFGWHKRAGEVRQAPRRHEALEYNRPRCDHGSYFADGKCVIDEHCLEFRERKSRR